jgi:alkaline phosphatase
MHIIILLTLLFTSLPAYAGNVIFFHPDGIGVNGWNAYRYASNGIDGAIAWDSLPHIAFYNGTHSDRATATSNGAATAHATGKVVSATAFGSKGRTLATDAMAAGKRVALLQTGAIYEPGTAAFVAHSSKRTDFESIAAQVMASGADIIMAGGEEWLLPRGATGRTMHAATGKPTQGRRTDGRDLLAEAAAKGYALVFTADDLDAVCNQPQPPERIIGIFATGHTFDDRTEEELSGKPTYASQAPTMAAMMACALKIFGTSDKPFFIVAEEEGSDNFGNKNNATGYLEALARADSTLATVADYVRRHPDTLLITTSDSDAGGIGVITPTPELPFDVHTHLPERQPNGAPLDGQNGTGSTPFITTYKGKRLPFAIGWTSFDDLPGTTVVRALGNGAGAVKGRMHSTDVHDVMQRVMFEE